MDLKNNTISGVAIFCDCDCSSRSSTSVNKVKNASGYTFNTYVFSSNINYRIAFYKFIANPNNEFESIAVERYARKQTLDPNQRKYLSETKINYYTTGCYLINADSNRIYKIYGGKNPKYDQDGIAFVLEGYNNNK